MVTFGIPKGLEEMEELRSWRLWPHSDFATLI
jgi:hypothetical protein